MHTKELSLNDLKLKLGPLLEERPRLANFILSGQTAYSEKGETFALKGSGAAKRGFVTRDADDPKGTPLERLGAEINADISAEHTGERDYMPPVPLADRERVVAEIIASRTPAKVGHTRMAALLEGKAEPSPLRSVQLGKSRIETQRADQAGHRSGHVQGKRPSKMAALFDGTEPKGAA